MAEKRDYYEVLGVTKEASEDEIKKAFKKKAREFLLPLINLLLYLALLKIISPVVFLSVK